jgi:MFS family permease
VEALESRQGRGVLAVPDYRRLWLVGLLVSIARWLEMLVVSVVVFQATHSALLVAGMTLLRIAPMGLFGVVLGVLADRVPRRSAMLTVLTVQGCTIAWLVLLSLHGAPAVWQVAVASFLGGLGWATDHPVRRMLVGEAVGPPRMVSAMSLDVMANNASRVAGPALGGTLLASLGPAEAFGLSVLLYLSAFVVALPLQVGRVATRRAGASVLRGIVESFALVPQLPRLRAVLIVTVVFNIFAWPCTSMVPVIGQVSLGLGPDGVGVLAGMDGLGALLGAALVGLLVRPHRQAVIYVSGTALYLVMLAAFALSSGPVTAGTALLLTGVGGAGFSTMQATLTYLSVPTELRGRALGVLSTAIGTGLIGFLQVGLLAEWLGAPRAMVVIAASGLAVLAVTWRWWRVILRPE